ncbi:acetyl-CoA decarbonylase/synthase complex subunit delta [Deltaproteobacteria bacterium Smac51]|nr:acetyl-CoA decarbonylase/synthase complex subunit delta [Deltaproteobacteria bacterium Smac51]
MSFKLPVINYKGRINEVALGSRKLLVGGQNAYNFHSFEGSFPHPVRLALDVWDCDPADNWPEVLRRAYEGVTGDPGAWAAKCVEYGADLISLHLKSSDPAGLDTGGAEAVKAVGAVLEAVEVPVVVYGVGQAYKDQETLMAVCEAHAGQNLTIGPLTNNSYRKVAARAMAGGHAVIALSATDVNLAEQLNILLTDLGMPRDKILMDPTTAALGYGMEYCYSVMERMEIGALAVNGEELQQPIINFLGEEVWRTKEVGLSSAEHPNLGAETERGVMLETTAAITYLCAGSSILSLCHPQSLKNVREFMSLMG